MSERRIRQLHYQKLPSCNMSVPTITYVYKKVNDVRPEFDKQRSDRCNSITNGFRYTFQPQENNQSQIHFFEIFTHSQVLISTYITECRKMTSKIIEEKEDIKRQMGILRQNHEREIDVIKKEFKVRAQQSGKLLKQNYVMHSNISYQLNKEVLILTKDKLNLEDEFAKLLKKIIRLEKTLQGVEMNLICENNEALQQQLRGTFQITKTITQ